MSPTRSSDRADELHWSAGPPTRDIASNTEIISSKSLQREIPFKMTEIDELTHDLSQHKRLRYGKRSGTLDAAQVGLLEETLDADRACRRA